MTESDGKHILIVDDNPKNVQLLGMILKKEGYRINVANNGVQALKMMDVINPDLILLDIMMPVMDGFETCKKLKEDPDTRDVPVIFLTAMNEVDDIIKGFEIGAADYVTKPFNNSVLIARVKTHVALRRQAIQLEALSFKDGLTMIANRRRFDSFLDMEWRRCLRAASPISLIMIDIDHFKLYNDTYGHLEGDEALKAVARAIEESCKRPTDLAARYGGEEFGVILGNTDYKGAYSLAGKIRERIYRLGIEHKASLTDDVLTVSIGVASEVPGSPLSHERLIKFADSNLYKAKKSGRNQVV